MPPLIIPLFIPNQGCPHHCIFCDQKKTSGEPKSYIQIDSLVMQVEEWLSYRTKRHTIAEIAFFGGTFTGLSLKIQERLLSAMFPFVKDRRVDSLRISTRPDTLTRANLSLLSKYHVETVELGVQSMDGIVLSESGRGYSPRDVISAVRLLREFSFKIGIQLMPGLPGDTLHKTMESARKVSNSNPDFVRIYPTVVIKGTPLYESYIKGEYFPLSLSEAIEWCGRLLFLFKKKNINVIRIGLQPTPSLEKGNVAAGPYHPSFRHLVESYLAYLIMESAVTRWGVSGKRIIFKVPKYELSNYIGQKRGNIIRLIEKFNVEILVESSDSIKRGTFAYDGGDGLGGMTTGMDLLLLYFSS